MKTSLRVVLTLVGLVCLLYGQSNETVAENNNVGTTAWQLVSPALNREIEGYASLTSVNAGGSISFFVSTTAPSYTIDVYRLGWYGGAGGRQMISTVTSPGLHQITPVADSFGRFECNWTNPYVLSIPANWVSGIYLAKLTASTGPQSYIQFVVREDSRASAFLFQHSVTTDQAYNNWPGPSAAGKSLYGFNSAGGVAAVKVSFNRPYFIDSDPHNNTQVGTGFLLRWEVMMLRWMEKNGYDVTYCTNIDNHENASLLLTHKAFLSVGHDEYWSWEMRANVEAARDKGVSLGFFSANVCYWQIRLETSPISGVADRTIVAYKETAEAGLYGQTVTNDPTTNPCLITTNWRFNSCKPSEQAFVGVEYLEGGVGCPSTGTCTDMVIADPTSWALAGTGLAAGSHIPSILGYEVDGMLTNVSPSGTQVIAKSPIPVLNVDAQNHPFSEMVTYTVSSGATVVAVGTFQWTWALDDWGAPAQRPSMLSAAAQKITQNILQRFAGTTTATGPPVSDTFNTPTLNTSLWNFVNPQGDGSYSMTGTQLKLNVPGGSNHDPAFGGVNNSVRVLQPIGNVDFTVTAKFDSIPNQKYQFQGIVVDQGPGNYVFFQFGSTGTVLIVNSATIVNSVETAQQSATIAPGGSSLWLRVQRNGNNWTESWSADGSTFSTVGTFAQALTATDIGLWAGNYNPTASSSPAFSALVESFVNGAAATAPNLTITKSHSGNFTPGQTGATYTLTVTNSGNASSSGTVTVTDTVPSGLTAASIAGAGWTCTQPAGPCTRGDALAAGSSYPAVTLTVNVASNAPGTVTNNAAVSGGGNASTNTASDPTTITSSAGGPVSDDFNTSTLNTSLWSFVNPVGDGSFSLTGTQLKLNVPAAANHVPGLNGTDTSVRMLQPIGNVDFTVTAKFDSIPTQGYTFEGILVHQDSSNYLLFQFGSTGSQLIVNSAIIVNTVETSQQSANLAPGASSLWLRVQRSGNNWTESWSADGNTFSTVGTFTQALTTTDVGVWAGNYNGVTSSSPAYAALIDSFVTGAAPAGGPPVGDAFNTSTLNTSLWSFLNPVGDGSYSMTGSQVKLSFPGGPNHDPAFGGADNAVRIVQAIGNVDFTVTAKFDSIPTQKYQFEGIVVDQNASNYVFFQFGSTGSALIVNSAVVVNGAETAQQSATLSPGVTSLWLRVQRSGSSWTEAWSQDGTTFTTVATFTQALTATDIGLWAGNYNPTVNTAPAFSALVDSFN
jgi:uncharacterized repeat protein (TIGR01451 family)